MFFVIMGWILFRADDLASAAEYYKACFGAGGSAAIDSPFLEYARQYAVYLFAGVLLATPAAKLAGERIQQKARGFSGAVCGAIYAAGLMALFIASVSFLVKGSYNPFIYFNF